MNFSISFLAIQHFLQGICKRFSVNDNSALSNDWLQDGTGAMWTHLIRYKLNFDDRHIIKYPFESKVLFSGTKS